MMCQSYFEPAISTIRTLWWTYTFCTDDKISFTLGTIIHLLPDSVFSSTLEFFWCWFLFSALWNALTHTLIFAFRVPNPRLYKLKFHIPYTLSTLTSHGAVPMHCANQLKSAKRSTEQISHIYKNHVYKRSHLYRTIKGEKTTGQSPEDLPRS